jgi:hypothetical protein
MVKEARPSDVRRLFGGGTLRETWETMDTSLPSSRWRDIANPRESDKWTASTCWDPHTQYWECIIRPVPPKWGVTPLARHTILLFKYFIDSWWIGNRGTKKCTGGGIVVNFLIAFVTWPWTGCAESPILLPSRCAGLLTGILISCNIKYNSER